MIDSVEAEEGDDPQAGLEDVVIVAHALWGAISPACPLTWAFAGLS